MEELVIEVERRSSTGKGHNRKLRKQGTIPAVVYGGGKESVPVSVDRHAVTELLRQEKGRNTVFLLKMKGTKQERQAMLRDAQIDPLTRQYIHLDFIRVMKGQRLKVEVPVVLEGESAGVKIGGFLDWLSRSLHIECAAESIPPSFVVDVSDVYDLKRRALACHASQFRPVAPDAAETRLTSPLFLQLVESRDAQFGATAGVRFAEGFIVREPVVRPLLTDRWPAAGRRS